MTRFLVAVTPVTGHMLPTSVLVAELVRRGHDVAWYTGAAFRTLVEGSGAQWFPLRSGPDWSVTKPYDVVPELRTTRGVAQARTAFSKLFIDGAPPALADLGEIHAGFRAEVVLGNALSFAARWFSELHGVPHANIGTTVLGIYSRDTAPMGLGLPPWPGPIGRARNAVLTAAHRRIIFGPVSRHLDDVRSSVGLPRQGRDMVDTFATPYLYLQDTAESFEYPRSDLPPQVHFIGPLLTADRTLPKRPQWWDEATSGRPVVLVTQGTVTNVDDHLIGATLEALAGKDPLVIVAGADASLPLPDPLPSNVRIEGYVPMAALMPHVTAYVTNGGYGGVQRALAQGVPIVVAAGSEDKPEVAARVAWSGAGIRLPQRPSAAEMRRALEALDTDPHYRANGRRIADDMASHRPAEEGADLLEQLGRTHSPVIRGAWDGSSRPN
ncbi:glycosyltransferase [Sinomonas sp. P10A9]|uniref:Glycosyltransferase n=1 Tax=Sinomonas puerhi TaxID=3238584 RepID=A0AB39L3R9_9MICC